ncbi:MAG: gluconokinase [bacterium]
MSLWVISGVAGSGKTSLGKRLAARLACPFLDADDFHPPANIVKLRSGAALDEEDRGAWLDGLCAGIAALGSREAVLAFPGLKQAHRIRVLQVRPDARFIFLRADLPLIEQRLRQRGGFFPAVLAESQFQDWEPDPKALELDAARSLDALEVQVYAWARPDTTGF